jgi:NAD(P)-dependent dehydrogenase (short-subunit alcohol dehydrogenase family)
MVKYRSMKNLYNKIILVTGGSGLLGKSIIKQISMDGGISINLDIMSDSKYHTDFIKTDITNDISVDNAINIILDKYGRIDGLVNNAYPRTRDWGTDFENIKLSSWKKNIDIQLNSYFNITQKVLKLMKSKEISGSIINIGSIYGSVGNDFNLYKNTGLNPPAAYSAIKGGLINLTRYLASYYGEHNIRVNCVSPGGVFDNQSTKFVSNYVNKVPLNRMAKADDISPLVSFMLSEKASYITGQNFIIDGGYTCI